jgi:hypothetical protein
MQKTALPVVVLALVLCGAPAFAEDAPPAEGGGGKRPPDIGLALDRPFESLRTGEKVGGVVRDPALLSKLGLKLRKNERVAFTPTGRGTFTIDVAGKSYKYKYAPDGTITPQL